MTLDKLQEAYFLKLGKIEIEIKDCKRNQDNAVMDSSKIDYEIFSKELQIAETLKKVYTNFIEELSLVSSS